MMPRRPSRRPFSLGGDIGKMLRIFGGRMTFYGIAIHHWGFGFIHWNKNRDPE